MLTTKATSVKTEYEPLKAKPSKTWEKLKIIKILESTPGGRHKWVIVETKDGKQIKIRKQNENI